MTIDEIYKNKQICARTYNVCIDNNINSIERLKEYYLKHKSFEHLKNCGQKTNEELIDFCINHPEIYNNIEEIRIEKEN